MKAVRVFVSSTFRDMVAERDYLNRFVFPELRSRCSKKGIEFIGIDLRWGITEEEAQQRKTLSACLIEIKQADLVICMLGDRYGWIPPPDEIPAELFEAARMRGDIQQLYSDHVRILDEWYKLDATSEVPIYRLLNQSVPKEIVERLINIWEMVGVRHAGDSITAEEIFHGVFDSANSNKRAFFYLRESGIQYQANFPQSFVPVFVEQSNKNMSKLVTLKQQIEDRACDEIKVSHYHVGYAGLRIDPTFLPSSLNEDELKSIRDGIIQPKEWPSLSDAVREIVETHGTVALTEIEELGKRVQQDLWSVIESGSKKDRIEPAFEKSIEAEDYNERIVVEKTRFFTGRQDLLKKMLDYISSKDGEILVITGLPGCGKSALMAECVKRCRQQFPNSLTIPYFIGAAPGSSDLLLTVRSLCEILKRECINIQSELPSDPDELRMQLPTFLEKGGSSREIILILDAVNQLDPSDRSQELTWLPLSLPSGVHLIVSTLADDDGFNVLQKSTSTDHILEVPPLARPDQVNLINEQLLKRGKKLTQNQIMRLLDTSKHQDVGLPLYLMVAIEELCLFGDYDFLNNRIDSLRGSLEELFDQVLQRLEMDHGRDLTELILRWLAVSNTGLLESEILDLLKIHYINLRPINWTHFYHSLEFYLRPVDEKSGLGLIYFYHDQLLLAIYRRYLGMNSPYMSSSTQSYRNSHNQLADYFKRLAIEEAKPKKWKTDNPRSLNKLPYHLYESGRREELKQILFDFDWIISKNEATDITSLISDYDYFPDIVALRYIRDSLRLSAHILTQDKQQLGSQLYGRLNEVDLPEIKNLLNQIIERKGSEPWIRPITSNLSQAGGPLIYTLQNYIGLLNEVDRAGTYDVDALAITPDGKRVVSGSKDKTLKIWDLQSGKLLRLLEGHTGDIYTVAITPDGKRAVSGSRDHTLKVWDLQSGRVMYTLEGVGIPEVAITPDGERIIGTTGSSLSIWDLQSGRVMSEFNHGWNLSPVSALAITPDGKNAISADTEFLANLGKFRGTLYNWDLQSGRVISKLRYHNNAISAVAITPDGKRVVSGSWDYTLQVWDLQSGKILRKFWSLVGGKILHKLKGHNHIVNAVAITPDGKRAVSASNDKTLKVWDLQSGRILDTFEGHSATVNAVAITPDGKRAVSASSDMTLKVWDLENMDMSKARGGHTNQVLMDMSKARGGHTNQVLAVAITPDGKRAVSSSLDGTLKVWDLQSGKVMHTMNLEHILKDTYLVVRTVAITPDGKRAMALTQNDILIDLDVEKGRVVESGKALLTQEGDVGRSLYNMSITLDMGYGISGSADKTLRLWNLTKCIEVCALKGHDAAIVCTAITPDGKIGISGSLDRTIKVWDLENKKLLQTLKLEDTLKDDRDMVSILAITPDGKRAVSTSGDKRAESAPSDLSLKLWDLQSGRILSTLEGHRDEISAVAITPDGKRAVSASKDRILNVWDLESGKIITSFHAEDALLKCAISQNGDAIIGEWSGQIYLLRFENA